MFYKSFCVIFNGIFTMIACDQLHYKKLEEVPPFFKKEDFDRCGVTGNIYIPGWPLEGTPPQLECSRSLCLLKASGVLNADFSIDYAGLQTLLDSYAARNRTAAGQVRSVSRHCVGAPAGGPCEADVLVNCLVVTYSVGYLTGDYLMPARCRSHPSREHPHACCTAPPLFRASDYENCGSWRGRVLDGGGLPTPPAHYLTHGCSSTFPTIPCPKDACLLYHYKLIDDDGKLNIDSVKVFLDNYAKAYPAYSHAVGEAKRSCVAAPVPGPSFVCEAQKFIHCVTSVMAHECPNW